MPNSINVPTPPMPAGDAENKIRQLHSYLFRLSEQLALILNSMESGSAQAPVSTAGGDIYAVREQLKQLIVNTTATLRQEMAGITSNLMDAMDTLDDALRQEISKQIGAVNTAIDDLENALTKQVEDLTKALGETQTSVEGLQTSVDGISLTALGVRSGTAMCTNALAGGQHEDISVSFDELPAVPVVVASLIGTGADGEYGGNVSCQVLTNSITKNSFLVRVACSTGQTTAYSYGVSWIAIAEGEQDGNTD